MKTIILTADTQAINDAATLLGQGEIVAFPTETVYGLGARIFDDRAIVKIFDVKGRPSDNPLIAHISGLSQVGQIAENLPPAFEKLATDFFPGPLTLVVPKRREVPGIASAGLPTIGIRMPNHPVALELITAVGEPLVAPSANLSGKPSPTDARHVLEDLNGKIPLILDGGPCAIGIESTVLDLTVSPPIILRPGHISKKQLEETLQQPVLFSSLPGNERAKAPGMKYRHYAPNAAVSILTSLRNLQEIQTQLVTDKTVILTNTLLPPSFALFTTKHLDEQTLYAAFRDADLHNINRIIILLDEQTAENTGLMNRIEKAANII